MLKKGQIEQKEFNELKSEIDKRIYFMQMHPPEIELINNNQKI
jgi:uncharacterized protein YcgL (UPF0745 family)